MWWRGFVLLFAALAFCVDGAIGAGNSSPVKGLPDGGYEFEAGDRVVDVAGWHATADTSKAPLPRIIVTPKRVLFLDKTGTGTRSVSYEAGQCVSARENFAMIGDCPEGPWRIFSHAGDLLKGIMRVPVGMTYVRDSGLCADPEILVLREARAGLCDGNEAHRMSFFRGPKQLASHQLCWGNMSWLADGNSCVVVGARDLARFSLTGEMIWRVSPPPGGAFSGALAVSRQGNWIWVGGKGPDSTAMGWVFDGSGVLQGETPSSGVPKFSDSGKTLCQIHAASGMDRWRRAQRREVTLFVVELPGLKSTRIAEDVLRGVVRNDTSFDALVPKGFTADDKYLLGDIVLQDVTAKQDFPTFEYVHCAVDWQKTRAFRLAERVECYMGTAWTIEIEANTLRRRRPKTVEEK